MTDRAPKAANLRGSYQRRAAEVRRRANQDPATTCFRCGRTKAEHGRPWHAGALNPGQVGGPLAPVCEACSRSHAAKTGNQRRTPLGTTREW